MSACRILRKRLGHPTQLIETALDSVRRSIEMRGDCLDRRPSICMFLECSITLARPKASVGVAVDHIACPCERINETRAASCSALDLDRTLPHRRDASLHGGHAIRITSFGLGARRGAPPWRIFFDSLSRFWRADAGVSEGWLAWDAIQRKFP